MQYSLDKFKNWYSYVDYMGRTQYVVEYKAADGELYPMVMRDDKIEVMEKPLQFIAHEKVEANDVPVEVQKKLLDILNKDYY